MQADAVLASRGPGAGLRRALARYRSAALMAGSRLAAVAAQFAVQAAVGALGGASALGILQLFQSWTSIGGEVAARGLPTRAMRESAVDFHRGDICSVQRRAACVTFGGSNSEVPKLSLVPPNNTSAKPSDRSEHTSHSLLHSSFTQLDSFRCKG